MATGSWLAKPPRSGARQAALRRRARRRLDPKTAAGQQADDYMNDRTARICQSRHAPAPTATDRLSINPPTVPGDRE